MNDGRGIDVFIFICYLMKKLLHKNKKTYVYGFVSFLMVFWLLLWWYSHAWSIGDVSLKFCETLSGGLNDLFCTSHLSLDMNQEEERDIWMKITNGSHDVMNIKLNFVDGTVTNDSEHKKACKDEWNTQAFAKFVHFDSDIIHLNPGETVEKHATLKFPKGMWWQKLWCVTYYQAGALAHTWNDMLRILVRKANFIDVNLSGKISAGLLWITGADNKKISISKEEWLARYRETFILKNVWSVQQSVVMTGLVKGLFTKKASVNFIDNFLIPAGETLTINKSIHNLPWYALFAKVTIQIDHTLVSIDDAEHKITDDKVYKMAESTHFWVMNLWIILVLVSLVFIVLLLLFMVYHHKRAVKHAQKRNYHHSNKVHVSAKKNAKKKSSSHSK